MSVFENVLNKMIENDHQNESIIKNLMQKELLEKKKTVPFHIDCKFTKKRICHCQYFEGALIPKEESEKFIALSQYLTNYYNGVKDEDYKTIFRKKMMAQEKIKCLQEAQDVLYYIPKYQKFLEKEEFLFEKLEPIKPKNNPMLEECSNCKSKGLGKFHAVKQENPNEKKVILCNDCYIKLYPESFIKKENIFNNHKSKKSNSISKTMLGKRKAQNWQSKHSYVRNKDKKFNSKENLENRFCCWKTCNKNDNPEDFLICKKCERSFHAKCCDPPLCKKLASRFDWFCTECKVCNICLSTTEENELLICEACDRAFHIGCLLPKRNEIPDGKWYCADCQLCKSCQQKNFEILENEEDTNKIAQQIHKSFKQFIFCSNCYPSIANKKYCPTCVKTIPDDSLGNFILCDKCLLCNFFINDNKIV